MFDKTPIKLMLEQFKQDTQSHYDCCIRGDGTWAAEEDAVYYEERRKLEYEVQEVLDDRGY